MSSIKIIVGAFALATAMICISSAETTVTLPDVNAKIYGKLNYMAYYNEDTSNNGVWKSGNNASRIGLSISEASDINAFGKLEVGVNVDDSGSDTFTSRLAYLGVDGGDLGKLSVGRQDSVFTAVTGATDVFNVYGSNADQNQGSRLSNTLIISNGVGPASVSTLIQMDGADNTKDIDKYEISANLGPVSVGYSKDNNTEIDYMAVSGSHDLGYVAISAAYSIKDSSGTETKGYEVVGTVGNISVGYGEIVDGDSYITAGIDQPITGAFSVYAEYQLEQNVSSSEKDQNNYAIGTKIVF